MNRAWFLLVVIEEGFALAQKIKENAGESLPSAEQCGQWTRNINGGLFTSPNYPNMYPANKECVYILEALPRQRIQLAFDKTYYIEPSFECRFDHIEIRDGPFGFSPLIDRFCGPKSPGLVTSTGRFMWIKFTSDEELEGLGFRVKYTFIAVWKEVWKEGRKEGRKGGREGGRKEERKEGRKEFCPDTEVLRMSSSVESPACAIWVIRYLSYHSRPRFSFARWWIAKSNSRLSASDIPLSSLSSAALLLPFEVSGSDGVIRSGQVEEEDKIKNGDALDCIWTIRAPPHSKIYLRFLEYQMEHSNECKKNFVAVYDGSSAIENLKAKFCSTVANDVMLDTGVGVVRMWADESSRLSRFRMLFTSFVDPPCSSSTFFCHSNMCINNSLVCNGVQNCVYPWDENHCKEKKSKGLFHQITKTHGTVIGISAGIVLVLLIISILVQMKQPRKKVVARRPAVFNKSGFQEVFDPPNYELFSLRDKELSSELADLSDELDGYHKLRRSSTMSRCIHEHHCGAQAPVGGSMKQSRSTLSSLELSYHNDFSKPPPMKTFNSSSSSSGCGTYKKSCYGYKQTHECAEQVIEDRVMEEMPCEIYVRGGSVAGAAGSIGSGCGSITIRNHSNTRSNTTTVVDPGQRSISMDF
ncbi:hypothetical protein DNTS_012988 [Danionella cerebrum]|uniref:CUB domain-containing protein n=1 Tax=Danionella cerebrum TaxID=2873325 RepID=A0A553MU69_9TELE|nr:hypothetical protein DNTS_012988 [Danionella translucida]